MADPITQILQVSLPGAGRTSTYTLEPGTTVQFAFDLSEAVFTGVNGNLEIAVEGGGTVILDNYQSLAEAGELPPFATVDGEQVSGDVYLFAFSGAEETAEDLETAADGAAGGSGAGEYSDDPGALFDGIDALGPQGDAYSRGVTTFLETLNEDDPGAAGAGDGEEEPVAPTAADDANQVDEAGDPDLYVNLSDPESHIRLFGEGETQLRGAIGGELFPLASMGGEGGVIVDYPDLPQIDTVINGNVILGDANGGVADVDPDTLPADLRINSIDYDGADFNSQNPGAGDVPDGGSLVVPGKYGTLVMYSDGSYTYTLNQTLADELEEGETFDEVFRYDLIDPDGLTSDTATLTITVNGFNDAPVAVADADAAIEGGDADIPFETESGPGDGHIYSSGALAAAGNVLANDWDVDDVDYPEGDDPNTAILEGTTALFVVGIYSHENQSVSYQLPAGGDPNLAASDPNAVWGVAASPNATFTLDGKYGTLVMHSDGTYTYTPFADGQSEALDALNYDNPGNETFSYAIMDDSGAFSYSTLGFTVYGANDAPVTANDTAEVVEFGAIHFIPDGPDDVPTQAELDAVSTVTGNVLGNDSDVDDTDIFVANAYTKNTDGSVNDSFDVYNDTDTSDGTTAGQVVLQGTYGTLTIGADGSFTYVADNTNPTVNAMNFGDTLTDTFYYTARNSYGDGVESDEAALNITINGTNDAPVAGADFTTLFGTPGEGWVSGSSAWSLLAQEFVPDGNGGGEWVEADLAHWGQIYGVHSSTDNTSTGFDKEIENEGAPERLAVNFESPQSVVVLEVTSHGGGDEMIGILDAQGNYIANDNDPNTPDPLDITFHGNKITVSYPGGTIGTVYLMAPATAQGNNRPDVALKDVSSVPAPVWDGGEATVASGNVLYNDYDIDSPSLEVLEAHALGAAWTAVDAETGDASGTAIAGQYGTLYLYENGNYTYVLDPDVLTSGTIPESETFEYKIVDSAEGIAYGTGSDVETLTINIYDTSARGFIQGNDDGNLLFGNFRDNAIFGMDGNDLIADGLRGDDLLDGGAGNDTLIGVTGDNTLYGSDGDDLLVGGIGGDVMWGGAGNDNVYGSFGEDTIYVSEGNDTIHVQSGNDTVVIDPAFIGMGGANATILNFHSGGDVLELGNVTGKAIDAAEVGSDLRITLSNPGGTAEADIVITLEDVSANDFTGGVELSDNAELNQLIQSIIDSGSTAVV